MKRNLVSILILIVIFYLGVGCGNQQTNKEESPFIVGVNQYMNHPMLDAVYEGFKDRLIKQKKYKLLLKIANADNAMVLQTMMAKCPPPIYLLMLPNLMCAG